MALHNPISTKFLPMVESILVAQEICILFILRTRTSITQYASILHFQTHSGYGLFRIRSLQSVGRDLMWGNDNPFI